MKILASICFFLAVAVNFVWLGFFKLLRPENYIVEFVSAYFVLYIASIIFSILTKKRGDAWMLFLMILQGLFFVFQLIFWADFWVGYWFYELGGPIP